jgi:hypothetical protein
MGSVKLEYANLMDNANAILDGKEQTAHKEYIKLQIRLNKDKISL